MKVVLEIPNILHEEKYCSDFLECLEIYTRFLIKFQKQLGLCYGLNSLEKFPIPSEFRNECQNGYVEIEK